MRFLPVFTVCGMALLLLGEAGCSRGKPSFPLNKSETFYDRIGREPLSLHPVRGADGFHSYRIHDYILESPLSKNIDSNEWEPALAEKWKISPDGMTITFQLYGDLKWSDGEPLTAEDVKFSFDSYRNPEHGGMRFSLYFEHIESAEVLDRRRIRFKAKEPYMGNFPVLANMRIFPKHIYRSGGGKKAGTGRQRPGQKSHKSANPDLTKTVIGSGPYKIADYIKGKMIVLTQNPLWAGRKRPHNKGKWQFKNIAFRFVAENSDALLLLQKGKLDFAYMSAENFEKAGKPPWGTALKKVRMKNKQPSGHTYIGLNLKNPLFQNRRARLALALLVNRKLINEKIMGGNYLPAAGPWPSWSEYADPDVKPIEFAPKQARALLRSAGWKDEDKDGLLEKIIEGKKTGFSFSVFFSPSGVEKILSFYQEELKSAGIQMKLKRLDRAAYTRMIEDRNFEAIYTGQGNPMDIYPKAAWHSESAGKGGSNYISYSSPLADFLIGKGRRQTDKKERIKTFRKLYRVIAEDVPCIFMFLVSQYFYGVSERIYTPKPYYNYGLGMEYWSFRKENQNGGP